VPVLAEFPRWFLFAFALPFGLVWGSFLNVVIHRVPRGESVVRPASRCPACGTPIRAWNNLPVLSYLLLRGRAGCCGARISPRYALVELLGGLLAAAVLRLIVLELPADTSIARALGLFALYLALGLTLIALTFIDLEFMELPPPLTLGGAALGFLSSGFRGTGWFESLLGGCVGFLIIFLPFEKGYQLLRGHPGMGRGDAHLTLLAGAWFGWRGALFALFVGAIQATLIILGVYVARGRIDEPDAVVRERQELEAEIAKAEGAEREELERDRAEDMMLREAEPGLAKARVPFGPFIALATLEYALFEHVGLTDLLGELFLPWS
jgi:leader peptidase (prepilin peptidase)/N-methyltransferase